MRLHVHKKALRALGISESFVEGINKKSVLAGVVMRTDMIVDGFVFSHTTLGGMDATEKMIGMYKSLSRDDINIIIINGCVISRYNVVDVNRLAKECELPVICVTYKDSKGLEKHFKELFPQDWQERTQIYQKNGTRALLNLSTGYTVYVRFVNLDLGEVERVLNKYTIHGSISEPLRLSRLLARTLSKMRKIIDQNY